MCGGDTTKATPSPAPVTLFPHQTPVVAIRQQFKSYIAMVSRMLVMVH